MAQVQSFSSSLPFETLTRLEAEHAALDQTLHQLNSRRWLTPAEQAERVRLKKMKLKTKDRIHALQSGF